jgi:hypothetical protein
MYNCKLAIDKHHGCNFLGCFLKLRLCVCFLAMDSDFSVAWQSFLLFLWGG